jgi:nitroreductase
MDIFDALLNRRSIRKYTNKKVSKEQIEIMIKSAMYAPSAVNKQPWHYIVFDDKEIIDKIVEVHPNGGMLKQASTGILICYDEHLQHDKGYGPVDCSAATQNMLLAAHGLGLGAVWVGIYPRENRIEALHKLFGLPAHVIPFSVVSVGYPDEKRSMPDRFLPERIHWGKW